MDYTQLNTLSENTVNRNSDLGLDLGETPILEQHDAIQRLEDSPTLEEAADPKFPSSSFFHNSKSSPKIYSNLLPVQAVTSQDIAGGSQPSNNGKFILQNNGAMSSLGDVVYPDNVLLMTSQNQPEVDETSLDCAMASSLPDELGSQVDSTVEMPSGSTNKTTSPRVIPNGNVTTSICPAVGSQIIMAPFHFVSLFKGDNDAHMRPSSDITPMKVGQEASGDATNARAGDTTADSSRKTFVGGTNVCDQTTSDRRESNSQVTNKRKTNQKSQNKKISTKNKKSIVKKVRNLIILISEQNLKISI